MLASLVFCFVALQTPVLKPTMPVVFSGVVAPGRCRIPLTISGQSYLFLVDTGIEKSYIRPDVKKTLMKKDAKASLFLGGASLSISDLPSQDSTVYLEIPPISGIIGMDVLSKLSFSVDSNKQQVTIWPSTISDQDLMKNAFPSGDEIATIPLISEPGYLSLFLQTSLGESELDTGAAVSLLAKSAAKSTDVLPTSISAPLELFDGRAGKATQTIVSRLVIGDHQISCQPMLLSDTTDVSVISASLLGRNILFDFPHKRVVYAVPSDAERACAALSGVLHAPVESRKGELYLKTQLARNLGATQDQWVKIVSIDGRRGSEWLTLLQKKDPDAALALRDTYDSLAKGGLVLVEKNGKPTRLLIAPFIR